MDFSVLMVLGYPSRLNVTDKKIALDKTGKMSPWNVTVSFVLITRIKKFV